MNPAGNIIDKGPGGNLPAHRKYWLELKAKGDALKPKLDKIESRLRSEKSALKASDLQREFNEHMDVYRTGCNAEAQLRIHLPDEVIALEMLLMGRRRSVYTEFATAKDKIERGDCHPNADKRLREKMAPLKAQLKTLDEMIESLQHRCRTVADVQLTTQEREFVALETVPKKPWEEGTAEMPSHLMSECGTPGADAPASYVGGVKGYFHAATFYPSAQ